jgi:hypothetical protein
MSVTGLLGRSLRLVDGPILAAAYPPTLRGSAKGSSVPVPGFSADLTARIWVTPSPLAGRGASLTNPMPVSARERAC